MFCDFENMYRLHLEHFFIIELEIWHVEGSPELFLDFIIIIHLVIRLLKSGMITWTEIDLLVLLVITFFAKVTLVLLFTRVIAFHGSSILMFADLVAAPTHAFCRRFALWLFWRHFVLFFFILMKGLSRIMRFIN